MISFSGSKAIPSDHNGLFCTNIFTNIQPFIKDCSIAASRKSSKNIAATTGRLLSGIKTHGDTH